jgi:serine/threonine-protein kinase
MEPHPRYEVLGLIGNGDFAAVYRARDRELGRDVAIKQIHGQYMNDPRRLERFWREAQLLATLSHAHIMTIYDIVRPRGWLVLELMQGTLLDACKGQPIDLNLLRATLSGSLQALAMLHSSHVIHGDIKPSNLMLDRLGRVKLGDFGLARRVANDQGSYLKGATRYMAPELVAAQFGPVGPASDLYSLGFAAYELLCGPQHFEQLFPGLDAFGRDRQIAWMMWHAAPDRRLPPVASVLDGVPPDLAKVIDKLTAKDQSQRYRTAEQALADLGAAPALPALPAEDEDEAKQKRQKFQKRMVAVMALVASVLMSVLVSVMPSGKKKEAPAPEPVAVRGVVRMIIPERQTLIVEQAMNRGPKEVVVREQDKVYLNDKVSLLRELKEADQVSIQTLRDDQGRALQEIQASRPEEDRGSIAKVDTGNGEIAIALAGADEQLIVVVGGQTKIELNGSSTPGGKPLKIDDLKSGDRVSVVHFRDQDRELALKISAVRVVNGEGVVRAIDSAKREVSIAADADENSPVKVWPLADKVDISLNGRKLINNRLLTPADLQVGDKVSFGRDLKIVSISASRHFSASGTIGAVQYDVKSFTTGGTGQQRTYVLAPECKVVLGGQDTSLNDLRRGDQFEVQYDDPDAASPAVLSITATRPADKSKWAVLIVCSEFDDTSIPALSAASAAMSTLQQTLEQRYAVPAEQTIVLANPSRIRLEQGLSDAVSKAGQAGQLLVVVAGRAFATPKGPVVAPKDFDKSRADVTGVPLATVLSEVDKSPIANKFVVLDLAPLPDSNSPTANAAAMVDSIRGTRSRPLLKATPILAADDATAGDAAAAMRLVTALPAAFTGAADPSRDNQITFSELNDYLKSPESNAGGVRSILPDTTPPRLSDDAKQAIRRLAAMASRQRYDKENVQTLIANAEQLAPKQPEPRIIGAIVLLKHKDFEEAQRLIGIVTTDHPKQSLAWEISAWSKFEKYNYSGGLNDLVQLMQNLPSEKLNEADRRAVLLAGRLREFSAAVDHQADRRPPAAVIAALDAAVNSRGAEVKSLFDQGRSHVRTIIAEFQRKIDAASEPSDINRLKLERTQVRNYVTYSWESAAQLAISSLDVD